MNTSISLNMQFHYAQSCYQGPGWSSRYSDSLLAGRYEGRIPVGAGFSAPVQTGRGAYPASYTMNICSFPGVKRPGRGVYRPPHLSPRLKSLRGRCWCELLSLPLLLQSFCFFRLKVHICVSSLRDALNNK
jgi:hypothetical protein